MSMPKHEKLLEAAKAMAESAGASWEKMNDEGQEWWYNKAFVACKVFFPGSALLEGRR